MIPGGLALFASILGRIASNLVDYWRAGVLGKRKVNTENHILLLGWNGQRTLHLIRMLQHEEEGNRPIVLCTRSDIENPLPGEIGFVKVGSYTDAQEMKMRALTWQVALWSITLKMTSRSQRRFIAVTLTLKPI